MKGKHWTDSCEDGNLNNTDEERVETFQVLFASVFNNNRSWAAQSPEVKDYEWKKESFPFSDTEIVHHNHNSSSDDKLLQKFMRFIILMCFNLCYSTWPWRIKQKEKKKRCCYNDIKVLKAILMQIAWILCSFFF